MDDDELPVFAEDARLEDAQAELEARELGDGLPLVPPTAARLDAMLAGLAAPMASRGRVPPLFGELTAAAVAYQSVLAGCRPGEARLVLAALEACLDPAFNLLGIQTTTGSPAVCVVVHGPIATRLGLNASTNCLGPGNRANACIGRAVALALRNVGGARPLVGDMATMGQPGKYTFCFAEGAGEAGFPPLPVRRGVLAGADAVSVLGVSGTAEVLPARPGDSADAVLAPVAAAMRAALEVSSAAWRPERGEQVFLLPPELARLLAARDYDLARVQRHLFERGGDSEGQPLAGAPEDIHPIVTGGAGVKMTYLPLWAGGTRIVTRGLGPLGE